MKCFVFFVISLVLVASAPLDNRPQVSVFLCYTVQLYVSERRPIAFVPLCSCVIKIVFTKD